MVAGFARLIELFFTPGGDTEVKDMAELVHQAEYLARHDRTLLYGPGRHGPGNNLFIYFHDEKKHRRVRR